MITLSFCLRRRPGLPEEEFHRYWREVHGPLVQRHASALRIQRYVQHHHVAHVVGEASATARDAPEPFDGIAELTWASVEDLAEAATTTAGVDATRELLADEARFIDFARSPIWLNDSHVVIESTAAY